jgi:hypothetical protein
MPLRFFVEYNNVWWFEIVTAVEVPTPAYDPASESGFIISVWLETGYVLATSTAAAQVFLRSPSGLAFAAEEPTAAPIARIEANLAALTDRLLA